MEQIKIVFVHGDVEEYERQHSELRDKFESSISYSAEPDTAYEILSEDGPFHLVVLTQAVGFPEGLLANLGYKPYVLSIGNRIKKNRRVNEYVQSISEWNPSKFLSFLTSPKESS